MPILILTLMTHKSSTYLFAVFFLWLTCTDKLVKTVTILGFLIFCCLRLWRFFWLQNLLSRDWGWTRPVLILWCSYWGWARPVLPIVCRYWGYWQPVLLFLYLCRHWRCARPVLPLLLVANLRQPLPGSVDNWLPTATYSYCLKLFTVSQQISVSQPACLRLLCGCISSRDKWSKWYCTVVRRLRHIRVLSPWQAAVPFRNVSAWYKPAFAGSVSCRGQECI